MSFFFRNYGISFIRDRNNEVSNHFYTCRKYLSYRISSKSLKNYCHVPKSVGPVYEILNACRNSLFTFSLNFFFDSGFVRPKSYFGIFFRFQDFFFIDFFDLVDFSNPYYSYNITIRNF